MSGAKPRGLAAAEWLERGLQHQREGRPVDAMLCFRRAARDAPQMLEPAFHLGEVLWSLGALSEAIATWRDAVRIAPDHPAARMALAEALLFTGDAAGARSEAAYRLQHHPRDTRARAIVAVADLDSETGPAAENLVESLKRMPDLLRIPAIGGALAQAIDRISGEAAAQISDEIVALEPTAERVAGMPAPLVAQVLERAVATDSPRFQPWLDAALARRWLPVDFDAIRRIAVAAVATEASAKLAAYYSALCHRVEAGVPPRAWPQRTRGAALRIVVVASTRSLAHAVQARLLSLPQERFDVRLVFLDADESDASSPVIATPAAPTAQDAKRIAALDPDVLVDVAGYGTRAGVLLAQRPARLQLTLAGIAMPHVAPLIDRVVPDIDALIAELESMQSALPESPAAMPDAATLTSLWVDAVARHQSADTAGALAGYEEILAVQGDYAPALFLRGRLLADVGDTAGARVAYAAALARFPDYVEARVAAIRAAVDARDVADASALATEGMARDDDPPTALLRACGVARLAALDSAGAAALFEAALAREPTDGETHYNHGVALQIQRRFADATRAYQRALTFRPELIAADFNLGVIFGEEGHRDAAIRAFTQVLKRAPAHVMAYRHLGDALFAAGRFDEWRQNFARFEANCPDALPLAVHALEVCQWEGDFAGVERYLEGLRNERFRAADSLQLVDSLEELLYVLLFFDVEPELYTRIAQTYGQTARHVYGPPRDVPAARRPGRIRVGYLSADMRNHVMGKMIWQAVSRHDREHFDVRFYSSSRERDAWTQKFEQAGEAFTVLKDMTDQTAAAAIADDDLDILVDLSTHTRGARPGIVAAKPARVAITHIASAGVVGLSCVDYRLTDAYCDVEENPPPVSETPLPMEGCVYPYRHVEAAGAGPTREALGIAGDAVVLGAFVTGMKLSRRCLALWRELLERLPHARLAFSPLNPAQAPLYARLVRAGGIAPERLVFVPQGADDAANQARYRLVDFVLDPMPYGGANGTLEALDMGVPVVTLVGRRHAERTSYSILANLGVTSTVADSGKHYVDIAVRLATDAAFMREVRASIRAGLVDSPLTDMDAHARHLENAYREALRARVPAAFAETPDNLPAR